MFKSTRAMSADGRKDVPPYMVPVEFQDSEVKVYHVYTPFTPPESSQLPVYTGGLHSNPESDGKNKFVSYDTSLGFNPGMATCTSCQQQVMTHVTYKAGRYAWLMCLLLLGLGLFLCCLPILFMPLIFMNRCKDAHHTCPRCDRVLHIEKRKCRK